MGLIPNKFTNEFDGSHTWSTANFTLITLIEEDQQLDFTSMEHNADQGTWSEVVSLSNYVPRNTGKANFKIEKI